MSTSQVFGVIGGAGVAATNKFNALLEKKITMSGAFRDMHHPEVISFQATKIPSRSMFLEGRGDSFIPGYIEIGKKLKKAGSTIICMTCNTAHFAIQEIQTAVNLPFINIIEEVVLAAKKEGHRNIGIMASDGSVKHKLYDRYFMQLFPESKLIYPTIEFQEKLTQGIINIKNKNRFKSLSDFDRPNLIFKKVSDHLLENGSEIIISGCTDIRVDFSNAASKVKIIDSLEVLVDEIYDYHKSIN